MATPINFLLAGVGGQGIILASDILGEIGMRFGYDVKKSEVHGMSQRGGMVESHVRWSDKVYSPLTGKGEVDYLVALETLEGARWGSWLKPSGVALVNRYQIPPLSVSSGEKEYPPAEALRATLMARTPHLWMIDAFDLAQGLGNAALAGVIMLGTLSTLMDVDESVWLASIESLVPARFLDLNRKAFMVGRSLQNQAGGKKYGA